MTITISLARMIVAKKNTLIPTTIIYIERESERVEGPTTSSMNFHFQIV